MTRLASTAAVAYGPGEDVDTPMAACAATFTDRGVRVGGLLQRFGARIAAGKRDMLLTVLPAGETIRLSEPRGPGVMGCTLDPDALARGAMALRASIRRGADLLLVGRFGKEEADGDGLRDELAEAVLAGIPLIVGVRRSLLQAWFSFLGGAGPVLAPDLPALLDWATPMLAQRVSAPRCAIASIAR